MCGICGFNWRHQGLVDEMTEALHHRGPDQHGTYCDEDVSLGHRRLSIVDLSELGRQPMINEDGSIQLVYNGEIYNFREIRDELEKRGHQFRSHTDSEVIIHAYEEYGFEAVHRFRGMFAIALWDRNKRRLWLVRDRIGIKPLYYYWKDGKFLFASEIKSILKDPQVPRELNHPALYAYLGFEFVPAPDTMFRHIHKIPAGHHLVLENGQIRVEEYWDLKYPAENPAQSPEEMIERIRALMDESVKLRLMSDVPLGAFLSGGLDSSALVAMMRRHVSGRLRTFTIGYHDKTFSELNYAQLVADTFATDHQVLMIEDMTEAALEQSIWHLDEPMTDLSSIPLMFICRQARQHVTVCLSGEGGDEVFAGYDRFKASKINRFYRWIPSGIRKHVLESVVGRMADRPQKKGAVNMLKRFMEGSRLPEDGRHLRWQYFSNARQDAALYSDAFKAQVTMDPFARLRDYSARCTARDRLNQELYLDTRFMMADSVLMKVDKMSMASALEIRVPLIDHKLVEYMATIPGDLKLRGLETKHIFRKALEGILPEKIIYRGKQGYSLPVKNLLRGQLKNYMTDLINDSPVIRENFNPPFIQQLIREHLALTHNHNHVLWSLMNVAIWHRRFFNS